MKKNEKGFSVVEIIIVIVVVGLIGAVGWYVVNSKNKSNNKESTTSNTQPVAKENKTTPTQQEEAKPKDKTANWKTYTSTLGGFNFKYPDNWQIEGYNKYYGQPDFDSDPVGVSKFTGKEYWLNIYSKEKNVTKNNFVVDMRIDPGTENNVPADSYGKGKVVKTLSNGFEIWQLDSDSCLSVNIVDSKSNKAASSLPNGRILKYRATFCNGQGSDVSYSLKEQLESPEYEAALDILNSIKFQ